MRHSRYGSMVVGCWWRYNKKRLQHTVKFKILFLTELLSTNHMAAKLLHTLADENSDLQKKIGCMNGIFQLFDRHNHVRKSLALGNHYNTNKYIN